MIMMVLLTSIVSLLLRKNEWTVMVGEANTGLSKLIMLLKGRSTLKIALLPHWKKRGGQGIYEFQWKLPYIPIQHHITSKPPRT